MFWKLFLVWTGMKLLHLEWYRKSYKLWEIHVQGPADTCSEMTPEPLWLYLLSSYILIINFILDKIPQWMSMSTCKSSLIKKSPKQSHLWNSDFSHYICLSISEVNYSYFDTLWWERNPWNLKSSAGVCCNQYEWSHGPSCSQRLARWLFRKIGAAFTMSLKPDLPRRKEEYLFT